MTTPTPVNARTDSLGRAIGWLCYPGRFTSVGFTIAVGLVVAVVLIQAQGSAPVPTLAAGLDYAVGDTTQAARTLTWALPLYVASMGVTVAFRSGMFNIGAEGQIFVGAMTAAIIGAYVGPTFAPAHLALATLGSALAGGAVAAGLGWLRAAWEVDEVLSTLLSNFIIVLFLTYLATGPLRDSTRQSGTTRAVHESAMFPEIIVRTGLTAAVFLVIAICVSSWWTIERSVLGYRWRMTGLSAPFSAAAGLGVNHSRITSMATSGALCGIAGGMLVTTSQGRFWTQIGQGIGWDAVLIALISRSRPLSAITWVTVYAVMRASARGIEQNSTVPSELSLVLISAIVIATVARPGLFSQFSTLKRRYSSAGETP